MVRAANDLGFRSNKILLMHSYDYNAEFYAGDRLQRDRDGRQTRLFGTAELREQMRVLGGRPVLVLVPHEYESQLTADDALNVKFIGSNREKSLAAVSLR